VPAADFFAVSRRQLRRARIQDVVTVEREGVNVGLHRNRLLEPLAIESADTSIDFDSLADDNVDMVVSLALADLDEPGIDSLRVLLLCLGILARDGQFARLAQLADKIDSLSRTFHSTRPYLTAALNSLSLALKGRGGRAQRVLGEVLGLSGAPPPHRVRRDDDQLGDLLAATAMRSVVENGDTTLVDRARQAAINVGDGTTLAYLDALSSWSSSTARARPTAVLAHADPTFRDDELQTYVEKRDIPVLYPAQVKAIEDGATRDLTKVISLPTSSGKTLIAEFRIAATLTRNPGATAIYVAPYRLLARQVERDFRRHLARNLGLTVRDLGAGYDITTPTGDLGDVVICTPEKLDALLRLATSNRPGSAEASGLFDTCGVLVFDELQLIGRPGRGLRFEMLVARIMAKFPEIPILGLAAASLGTDEVASWVGAAEPLSGATRPTGTLEILWDNDGGLLQRVDRRSPTKVADLTRSGKALDDAVSLILRLNAEYRPVLAVCVSRPNAESMAKKIVEKSPHTGTQWRDSLTTPQITDLMDSIEETRSLLGENHPLATYMERGIAFHHAGVPTPVLQQIERLASKRLLRVVCSTTTVAEGADLPFRVVVIPHLNFPGRSGRLERDLYLNIIGRAGRANVSVEGIVFILNSSAQTLNNLVRSSLWSTAARDRVRGQLSEATPDPGNIDGWREYQEVQSQVMGWLGDGDSYVDDQAERLASLTFSFHSGDRKDRHAVTSVIARALTDLEDGGYALAASPFQLTERGHAARLTGLSPSSVMRLELAIERGRDGWMQGLVGTSALTREACVQIAGLVYNAVEVFEHSLWMRRNAGSTAAAKFETLMAFAKNSNDDYRFSDEFAATLTCSLHG
jgi:hypothetical protein